MKIDESIMQMEDEDQLWKEHQNLSAEFRENISRWDEGLVRIEKRKPNYLDLKIKLATKLENPCRICERKCERKRLEGQQGYCLVPDKGSIASSFLHPGEEIVLIPSGTIFFNGCTFRCVFCQNWDIAHTKYLTDENLVSNLTTREQTLVQQGARKEAEGAHRARLREDDGHHQASRLPVLQARS